jgi:hypothetical protein
MNHTPGPWNTCNGGNCSCFMVSGEDHPIATIEHGEWGDEYPSIRLVGPSLDRKAEAYMDRIGYGNIPEEEAKANARLISSAPELLDSLIAMTAWCDDLCVKVGWTRENATNIHMSIDAARAAIAKAEQL